MSTRELRWWATPALTAAGASLGLSWRQWCDAWGVDAAGVVAMNACDVESAPGGTPTWEALAGSGAWLGTGSTTSASETMRRLVFGAAAPSGADGSLADASVSGEVARMAWEDLRSRLGKVLFVAGLAPIAGAPPTSDSRRWSGAIVLHLASASPLPIALHLSPEIAASFVGGSSQSGRAIASMEPAPRCPVVEAAHDLRVRIDVAFDDVTLDVATLGSLRCGDVLKLSHPLDRPLRVRMSSGDDAVPQSDLCGGLLGLKETRRAVELVRSLRTS